MRTSSPFNREFCARWRKEPTPDRAGGRLGVRAGGQAGKSVGFVGIVESCAVMPWGCAEFGAILL
jgi:hypothetical protein